VRVCFCAQQSYCGPAGSLQLAHENVNVEIMCCCV
jgi:hypothetical protein